MPVLLLTRPEPQSRSFLAACAAARGRPIDAVIAPLTRIEPTGAAVPAEGALVFTSGRAVELAGDLAGRRAYCVGDRTAELAAAAGAVSLSAAGTAEDLLRALLAAPPGPLVHLRGEETRGDLGPRLRAAGRDVTEIVLYRTLDLPLDAAAQAALEGPVPVVAPVFSPRGAARLAEEAARPPALVVAISAAAAEPFEGRTRVEIAARPDATSMRHAVLQGLGNLP